GDDLRAQGFGHVEPAIDFLVRVRRAGAVVIRVNGDAGPLELRADVAEVTDRRLDSPSSKVFARKLRLDPPGPQFALDEAALFHRRDRAVDEVAAGGTRQIAKAVRLHADAHAVHR